MRRLLLLLCIVLLTGCLDRIPDRDRDGYTPDEGDCDDDNRDLNPGAPELCDGQDNNCDGERDFVDADGDGVSACLGDCDDADPEVRVGATEVCDGIDNNCSEGVDEGFDFDGDGFAPCEDCDLLACYVPAENVGLLCEVVSSHGGQTELALEDAERETAKIPHVFEFCFNHTTLQVLKSDRSATYQQIGVPNPADAEAITRLRADLGDDVWTHHEFIRLGGQVVAIDLPIIWYSGPERLSAIDSTYDAHGFAVYNAHTNEVERGGLHNADYTHLAWKKRLDPKGLIQGLFDVKSMPTT